MYKPSSLAYPPIVAGTPAPYPLTSPMGGYMTPAAGYAPQYIPFHAPRRAYGDARSDMMASMDRDPLYKAPTSLFDVVTVGSTMLLGMTLLGGIGSIVLGLGSAFVAESVLPPSKRSARVNTLINMGVNVATLTPVVLGAALGTYGAYDSYMKYRAAKG
jgi:hypothetical protein